MELITLFNADIPAIDYGDEYDTHVVIGEAEQIMAIDKSIRRHGDRIETAPHDAEDYIRGYIQGRLDAARANRKEQPVPA